MFRCLKTLVGAALFALSCASCALKGPVPDLVPVQPQEPTEIQWRAVMPERVAKADGVAVATITEIRADWDYDDPCGILAVIAHQCSGTVTYRLHLSTSADDLYLWAFTPGYGSFGLFESERAVFVWRKIAAYPYKVCREQSGLTSAACNATILPALTDDLDVLPLEDSTRVRALRVQP